MTDPEMLDHRLARMSGCVLLAKWIFALLVVLLICVIGPHCAKSLFIGFSYSGSNYRLRTKAVVRDLCVASLNFHKEYQRFPIPLGSDAMMRSEGLIILALQGLHEATNPRKICFIDLPFTKEGYGGLIDQSGGSSVPPRPEEWTLLDFWGELYYITLDTNDDGEVQNPEVSRHPTWLDKHLQPVVLKTRAAIFSSGPDRDPKTWDDNICSWR